MKSTLTDLDIYVLPNEGWREDWKRYIYTFDDHLKSYFQSSPNFLLPTEGFITALEILLRMIKDETGNSNYITIKLNAFSQLIKVVDELLIKLKKYSEDERLLSIYNN